jgi:hypothetical protein
MKKLNKLEINPEKIMKNDELISLRGGTNCHCYTSDNPPSLCGVTGSAGSASECSEMCSAQGCPQSEFSGY